MNNNNLGNLDSLLLENKSSLENLPIEKRATIKGALSEELRIKEISTISYPNDKDKQTLLNEQLVGLCKTGKLPYYGDINGWSYKENKPNPYPKIEGFCFFFFLDGDEPTTFWGNPEDCLIHRDDFKAYLQSQNQWPIGGLLANWWPDQDTPIGNIKKQSRREEQINQIIEVAKHSYDDLLNIPEQGKATIKTECLKNPHLFTNDGFIKAWNEASKRGLISIANKEKYTKNKAK